MTWVASPIVSYTFPPPQKLNETRCVLVDRNCFDVACRHLMFPFTLGWFTHRDPTRNGIIQPRVIFNTGHFRRAPRGMIPTTSTFAPICSNCP